MFSFEEKTNKSWNIIKTQNFSMRTSVDVGSKNSFNYAVILFVEKFYKMKNP